ncbi:MAG: OB-fold domain-containing protein [Microthrixaceae bacterium]
MIGSLRGTLLDRTGTATSSSRSGASATGCRPRPATSGALGVEGAEVFVYVHHHIREDAQTLYGFAARDERMCFEALIAAHGVGPALALAILSAHSPRALRLGAGRRRRVGALPGARASGARRRNACSSS